MEVENIKKKIQLKKIITEYQEGANVKNLSRIYGVAKSTIYHWLKNENTIICNKSNANITYKEYCKMQKEKEKAIRDLEIFQKLHCSKDSFIKEKEEAIKKYVDAYSIKAMCRLLDLPKGTFYNYYLRKTQVTQNQIRDEELKEQIMQIFLDSDKMFGAKKIEAKLRNSGINTTLHKIQK